MSSETSDHKPPDDVESKMLRSLGLGTASNPTSVLSSPIDPLKAARQAIRSQAVAREYAERQLAHAEVTIQDLRTKLHHARQEKANDRYRDQMIVALLLQVRVGRAMTPVSPPGGLPRY